MFPPTLLWREKLLSRLQLTTLVRLIWENVELLLAHEELPKSMLPDPTLTGAVDVAELQVRTSVATFQGH